MSLFDGFESSEDVANSFDVVLGDDIDIIVAYYENEGYSGYAFVIFRQDGKVYEVNGGHCSCYGLEGQWGPEEVVLKELLARPAYIGWKEGQLINDRIRRELIKELLP